MALQSFSATVNVRNALAWNCNKVFETGDSGEQVFSVEHLTSDKCNYLAYSYGATASINLTNCLLVATTNWGNCSSIVTNHVETNSDPSAVFQTVGAAGHYLSTNSPYRNAGSTNINGSLLGDLRNQTTYPPLLLQSTGSFYTNDTNFSMTVQRDTDLPDLGYHYDAIDAAVGDVLLTNATITINPGAVVATFIPRGGSYGIGVADRAQIIVQGSPTNLAHIVRYNTVQEQANTNWSAYRGPSVITYWYNVSPKPVVRLRSADWSVLANDAQHVYGYLPMTGLELSVQDCQFHGGTIYQYTSGAVTNSVFDRVLTAVSMSSGSGAAFRNNLFLGGTFDCDPGGSSTNNISCRDNLFDRTDVSQWDNFDNGWNAYVTNYTQLTPTNGTDVILPGSPAYQSGALGSFYQPTNAAVINAGSRNATNSGLYHYTTTTNQVKEGTSIVDIGFHYLAVGSDNAPIDSNGDGVPDFLADTNGNGAEDVSETPWARPHIIQQPQTRVDRAGTNASFTVTAAGVATLSYQWQKNGTNLSNGGNISGATTTTLTVSSATNIDVGPYTVVVSNSYGSVTSSIVKLLLIPDWVGASNHTWTPSIGGGVWYQRKSTLNAIAGVVATNYPRPVLIGLRSDVAEEGYRFDLNTFAVDLYGYSDDLCSQECVLQSLSTNTEFIWSMPVPKTNSMNNYHGDGTLPTGDGFPWQKPAYYAAYLQYLIEKTNMSQSQIDSLTNSNYSFWTDTNCITADTNVEQLLHTNWANLRAKRGHPEPYQLKAVILGIEPYDKQEQFGHGGGHDYGIIVGRFRDAIRLRSQNFSAATGQTSELSKLPLGLHVDSSGKPPSWLDTDAPWFQPMLDALVGPSPNGNVTNLADFSYLDMYHYYEGGGCYSNIPCAQADKWDHRYPTVLKADGSAWVYPYYTYASSNWPPGVDYSRYLWMFGDVRVALTNYVDPIHGQHDTNTARWQIGCSEHGIYVSSGTNGDDMAGGIHWGLWLSESMWFNTTWDENWVFAEQKGSHAQLLWTYDSRTNYLTNHLTRTPGHYVYSMAQEFYGYEHHSNSFISSFITETNYSGTDSTNPVAYVSPDIVMRTFLNTNDGHYHLWVINQNSTNAYTNSDWQQWSIPYWKQLHADSPTDWNPIAEDWHPETITNKVINYTGVVTNFVVPPLSVNHIELGY